MKIRIFHSLWRFFTKPFRFLFEKFRNIYLRLEDKVSKNIRLELIITFIVCVIASFAVFSIINPYFGSKGSSYKEYDYKYSLINMNDDAIQIGQDINKLKISSKDDSTITAQVNRHLNDDYKILIVDEGGKVLSKSKNTYENQVDIFTIIKNSIEIRNKIHKDSMDNMAQEVVNVYPLKFSNEKGYVVLKGIPRAHIRVRNSGSEKSFLAVIMSTIFFVALFFYITGRKVKYIQNIALAVMHMANGNLKYRIEEKGQDELANLTNNINFMAKELDYKREKEKQMEETKNELITNVSHDLRTPLTSIIGYLNLIKDDKYKDNNQLKDYINIAYNKSEKLKILINELFEYTKLSGNEMKLDKKEIYLDEFLEQLAEEFVPIFEENQLRLDKKIQEDIKVLADGDKLVRVFENLIMNATRYSFKPGVIEIGLNSCENFAIVYIKNKGENIPKEVLEKLFDRFYRADKSRTQSMGGSGLGLAISKSIVELHDGKIWAECIENDIYFYVKIPIINKE